MADTAFPPDIITYLAECTQEERDQFKAMLKKADSSIINSLAVGTTVIHAAAVKGGRVRKSTKAELASLKPPMRPLNAWMGYRNFYLPVLKGLPQKHISKTMTVFWANDPFKSKWALLSKAYSVARGTRAKVDAPLAGFFALCAPLVGIIPPLEYLGLLGWQLNPPKPGEDTPDLVRLFTPTFDNFADRIKHTTLTVDDLVKTCYAAGFVTPSEHDSAMSAQGSLTMVSNPAPASVGAPVAAKPIPAPLGHKVLKKAAGAVQQSNVAYPYVDLFDPTTQFDISFDPAAVDISVDDGGRWNAFTPMAQTGEDSFSDDIMWSNFINTEL